jgi:hypothetical protein
VSEPNLTASTERALRAHNLHHRKTASEAPATAPVPSRKRVRLVPAKEETINRSYFFLREYRSDSDSDSTSDMSDEEENEDEAKKTEKNSEGENENEKEAKERKRSEDGGRDEENETEEEKESAHKEAEEPGTVVGGSDSLVSINWDGAKEKVVKRKEQKAHKKGMSGGWVMKKVLVLMGSADKVKGMVTRNKRHKSCRSRRPRSRHHVVMENTDGEDELYEMVDLHHNVGDEDYDTTDVEACEEVDEVEAQKAREEQAILFLIVRFITVFAFFIFREIGPPTHCCVCTCVLCACRVRVVSCMRSLCAEHCTSMERQHIASNTTCTEQGSSPSMTMMDDLLCRFFAGGSPTLQRPNPVRAWALRRHSQSCPA